MNLKDSRGAQGGFEGGKDGEMMQLYLKEWGVYIDQDVLYTCIKSSKNEF